MIPSRWQQIEDLFLAASERQTSERAVFLDEACGSDTDLRCEVEAMLASDEQAENFIEAPALRLAADWIGSHAIEPEEGRQVGPYQLIRELGEGGMGAVYLASRADDHYQKQVAVKLLKRGLDTDDMRRRFRHERQILANLDHPNIARLIDGGTTADGRPYLVMDYVGGTPITRYCDEHQLSTAERLTLFQLVCAAVAFAHRNLVIHRDIKPSNIIVTEEGTPKLLDFGIAKLLSADPSQPEATATVARIMTPQYASPEQVRGLRITTASDIYSLGVLLYRLLTGHHPYRFKTSTPAEIEKIICEKETQRPSTAIARVEESTDADSTSSNRITPESVSAARLERPDGLRRKLQGDLDNIVLMAMRKEPERRYPSVEHFSEDIRRHLEGLPVIATNDTFSYRATKFMARNKVGVAAAVIVVLAVLAGLTASIWQARVAAKERDHARQETAKAEELNKFLQSILSAASPEEKGKDAKVIEVLNDAAGRIDAEFSNRPELKASMLLTVGKTYTRLDLTKEAELSLREALKINFELYGEASNATAACMIYLGEALMSGISSGPKLDEAEETMNRGVEIERRLSPSGSKELAWGLFALGEAKVRRGEYQKAQMLLQESVAISDRVSGENNEDSASALISIGRAKQFSGDTGGAEAVFRQSIAIFRSLPPRYENRLATTLLNLGNLQVQKGSYDEAISTILEADVIIQKLGSGQANIVDFYGKSYLSQAYIYKHEYEKSAEAAGKVIDIGRKLGLAETPDFLNALNYLGLSLTRTGKAREGEPYLRESLELGRRILPKEDVRFLTAESALGECLTGQNRFTEAEPLVVGSYERIKATQGEKNARTILALRHAIELYEKWKKPQLASQYRALLLKP